MQFIQGSVPYRCVNCNTVIGTSPYIVAVEAEFGAATSVDGTLMRVEVREDVAYRHLVCP